MFEILDRASQHVMYIRVPEGGDSNGLMRLDRYNFEARYGKLHTARNMYYLHLDGDYRNCEADNIVRLRASSMVRLRSMIGDCRSEQLRDLAIAIVQLIEIINKRCGWQYYSDRACYLNEYYRTGGASVRDRKRPDRREEARRYYQRHREEINAKRRKRRKTDDGKEG